ncbi:MAG TPA: AAA family ATPase, partial [Spirochaetales bacterium]|nr:AAA family ATPase [Spirochaetales bacterium]
MRPVRLRLENFGPYRAPVEVDFEKLGGLFLVHGKTGSGKTTLFDAMTYALYGEAPGSRSSFEKQLASHWAEPGDESSVSFEFLASGKRYLAERNPPSRRLKRNGEIDYTPASAALSRFENGAWVPVAGMVSEVGAAVTALLGLSADEFSKVVLLPQGEFENFLRMNSRDRTAVLEKLFPVELHEASARLARDRAKAAEDASARVGAELARIAAAEPEGGAAAALVAAVAALETAETERQAAAAEATALALALEAARAKQLAARRAEEAGKRLAALEARRPELIALEGRIDAARRAAEAAPAIREAKRAAAELASVESRLEGFRAQAREIESNEAAIEAGLAESAALAERLASLDGVIGTLTAALEAWDRTLDLSSRRDRAAIGRDAALAAAAACGVALEEAERAFATLAVEDGEDERRQLARDAARAAYEAARDAKARADAHEAERAALERAAGELARAEAARAEAEAGLAALDARMLEASARRDASAAASLAAALVPGAPCPVCGSTAHPAPARPTGDDAPDADALRGLEAERRSALEAVSKAVAEAGQLADAVARGNLADSASTELEPSVAAAALAEAVRADEAAATALRDLAVLRRKRDEAARAVEAARRELRTANEGL